MTIRNGTGLGQNPLIKATVEAIATAIKRNSISIERGIESIGVSVLEKNGGEKKVKNERKRDDDRKWSFNKIEFLWKSRKKGVRREYADRRVAIIDKIDKPGHKFEILKTVRKKCSAQN